MLALAWWLICTSDGKYTGHTITLNGNDALLEALTVTTIMPSVMLQLLYCSDSKDTTVTSSKEYIIIIKNECRVDSTHAHSYAYKLFCAKQ